MADQRSQPDHHSTEWQTLERSMLSAEGRMEDRDAKHFTGTGRWLEGLHRRHAGGAMPKDRVVK